MYNVHIIFKKRIVPGSKLNPVNWFKSFREADFKEVAEVENCFHSKFLAVRFASSPCKVYYYPTDSIGRIRIEKL